MRSCFSILCVVLTVCVSAQCRADFILDDFSVAQVNGTTVVVDALTPVGLAGIGATPTGAAVTGVERTTGDSTTAIDGVDVDFFDFGTGNLIYNFAPSSSPTVDPGENFIVFRNVTTSAAGNLTATFTSANAIVSSVSAAVGVLATPLDLFLNITPISEIGLTSQIEVAFDSPAFGASLTTQQIDFTSAPEPTSMLLLGLTAVGGFIVRRRRKNMELIES